MNLTRPAVGLRNSESGDMERITGAACPKCGCEDSTVLGVGSWWGTPTETRQCGACGEQFRSEQKAVDAKPGKVVVKFVRLRCPHCSSTDVFTQGTRGRFRSHKCRACQRPFQSVEE